MLKIREIDHLVLRVRDMEAMIRFYGDVLGCPVHRIDEKISLVQLRAGRGLIDLIPVDMVAAGMIAATAATLKERDAALQQEAKRFGDMAGACRRQFRETVRAGSGDRHAGRANQCQGQWVIRHAQSHGGQSGGDDVGNLRPLGQH